MTNRTRIFLIILCSILIAACAVGMVFAGVNYFGNKNKTYAEEYDPNMIINFNQLINYSGYPNSTTRNGVAITRSLTNGSITINGTATDDISYTFATISITANNIYYIKGCPINSNENNFYLYTSTNLKITNSGYVGIIRNTNGNVSLSLNISNGTQCNGEIFYPTLINLTQCFGEGLEPSLLECEQLFTAQWYPYNTGTAMTLNSIQYNMDDNALINFNQLFDLNEQYTLTVTANEWYYQDKTVDLIAGHKYYLYIKQDLQNTGIEVVLEGSNIRSTKTTIITANSSGNYPIYFRAVSTLSNYKLTTYLIDLTQCFGENLEPTIEQCQQIFIANWYNYNLGTTMSLYGLDAYNAAFQDLFKSYQYNLSINALSSTTFAKEFDGESSFYYDTEHGSYSYWIMKNCIGIPLFTTLNKGALVEFTRNIYAPNVDDGYFTICYAYINENGEMVDIYRTAFNTAEQKVDRFTLPADINTLYIYYKITSTQAHANTAQFYLYELSLSATQLDVNSLVINANKSGQEIGYRSGYEIGYNKGLSAQNATLGTMDYIGAAFSGIGSILQIELLPGVPFSLFILLPLMFGLIAFVVKLSKGGN